MSQPEFRLTVRFASHGPDVTVSTVSPSIFSAVLSAALTLSAYVPCHLWTISVRNSVVASWMQGQGDPFIDSSALDSASAPGYPWERG